MKSLVTGAAGFVGRHLVAHLEACGDEIVGIDRPHGPDLLDAEALTRFVQEAEPDAVYHLAGWSDVGGSWREPLAAFRANADGTLNLLQACLAANRPRVLSVSSADVYGKVTLSDLPIDEQAPLQPVTPYAASKVAADFLGLQAFLGYGLDVLRVRAFNHLGPGQSNHFVAPAIAERIAVNELDGSEVVPVGNLTPATRLHRRPRRGAGLPAARRARRGGRGLQRLLGPRPGHQRAGRPAAVDGLAPHAPRGGPEPAAPGRDPGAARRSQPVHKATGWTPEIDIEQTLTDLLAEWRTRVGV